MSSPIDSMGGTPDHTPDHRFEGQTWNHAIY